MVALEMKKEEDDKEKEEHVEFKKHFTYGYDTEFVFYRKLFEEDKWMKSLANFGYDS
jgi:hypothetical protein